MDSFKLPKPNFTSITIAACLGVVVAVGLYVAQIKGLLPSGFSLPKTNFQTQTIIQEENAVIGVVEKTSSSVVAIGISKEVVNPLDPFAAGKKEASTVGTGFVVSNQGIIVTNKHVVSDLGNYAVITKDGQKYDVKKIYRDPKLDLAIVKIDESPPAGGLQPLELGDSSKLKVGQTVIAIGNSLGKLTNTVTTGVVSGLSRKILVGDEYEGSLESLDNLIQTDAAINLGNSGGPLLNSAGQVIGVSVATTEGAQNIGFGIPINSVKDIVSEFVTYGFISRPFIGIQYSFITKDLATLHEVPQGAYIQKIINGGPAEKAGIRERDIITKINGQAVDQEGKVAEVISKSKIGSQIQLTVWRNGKEINLQATLVESPN